MKLKDKIINAIGEDLKEYGFEYNKKDSGSGMWYFTRKKDVSFNPEYPSESKTALEHIIVQKSDFGKRLYLNMQTHPAEDNDKGDFKRLDQYIYKEYGCRDVTYENDEELAEALKKLAKVSIRYVPEIAEEVQRSASNARRGYNEEEKAYVLEHHKELGEAYREKYLSGKKSIEEIAEFTEEWIRTKHEMSFDEVWPYIAEAGSYVGDEAIRTGGGEWGEHLEIKRGKYWARFPFRLLMVVWLSEIRHSDPLLKKELIEILSGVR